MPALTSDQIQALDGAGLTYLAWQGGLAPAEVTTSGMWLHRYEPFVLETGDDIYEDWRPYENLAQADVVFRSLRARGWQTHVEGGGVDFGLVWAVRVRFPKGTRMIDVNWGEKEQRSEAHALLLCAVLAVVGDQETQP